MTRVMTNRDINVNKTSNKNFRSNKNRQSDAIETSSATLESDNLYLNVHQVNENSSDTNYRHIKAHSCDWLLYYNNYDR